MDWNSKTVKTYDDSAEPLAKFMQGFGSRARDIEQAIWLLGESDYIRAVEIGCGDGRDAEEIVKRVGWYEGFDPSEGMLKLARQNLPDTSFVLADALSYNYPDNVDIIFAFASLLHINKTDLKEVFNKVHLSLKPGGIFYISLKEDDKYVEKVQKDDFGERMFYLYSPEIIKDIAGSAFVLALEEHQIVGHTKWFTIAFKRGLN